MQSIGLVAVVGSLTVAALFISYRLATIATRLIRWQLLKRTSLVLPVVRPDPRSPFVPVTSHRTTPPQPREVVVVQPMLASTQPPTRSSRPISHF
jgi:hypothetical protein